MNKRMLIDATQPEETRVVLVSGNRVEDYDVETESLKQLKGNIYLARVTRVEPSLQAAFVEYGGNRHGFLAFNEIHPDYYRIPMEDREALLAEEAEAQRNAAAEEEAEEEEERRGRRRRRRGRSGDRGGASARDADGDGPTDENAADENAGDENTADENTADENTADENTADEIRAADDVEGADGEADATTHEHAPVNDDDRSVTDDDAEDGDARAEMDDASGDDTIVMAEASDTAEMIAEDVGEDDELDEDSPPERPETIGGDASEEVVRPRKAMGRRYKIQEVVTRRQIMLVQVVKEERGNKGAALTTYLSLAGRYCVLMPNTARGGGVSRKITNAADRKRLKTIVEGLKVPDGMAVIVRTAGSQRTKTEIKRDYEYLLRLWDEIRELTLQSTAPCLIYEEANLIKRSIRDLYSRDIDEVLVEGEDAYRTAKNFMRMLMPSHAKRVQPYRDQGIPLLHRFQIETQLDAIHSPTVQLRSGGYIVINQTEALVAIDVNSGRATRERNIEETALKTNLEAADEVARQLRLRDLAGLVVIDFIDMDENRNQHAVERRLKEAMKHDRARIQLGRISHFGLMELSRQRLRPSVFESSTQACPHCDGTGRIRSTESTALHVLRVIEEEGIRQRAREIAVHLPSSIGFYIINKKRRQLADIEQRYGFSVFLEQDDTLVPPEHRIERLSAKAAHERIQPTEMVIERDPEDDEIDAVENEDADAETAEDEREETRDDDRGRRGRGRRRRRRGGERRREGTSDEDGRGTRNTRDGEDDEDDADASAEAEGAEAGNSSDSSEASEDGDDDKRRRRRGRRGGRRRSRRSRDDDAVAAETAGDDSDRAQDDHTQDDHTGTNASGSDDPGRETAGEASHAEPTPEPVTEPTPEPEQHVTEVENQPEAEIEQEPVTAGEATNGVLDHGDEEPGGQEPRQAVAEVAAAETVTSTEEEAAPAPEPNPLVNVETVDKPAEKPKRGWWNQLTGR